MRMVCFNVGGIWGLCLIINFPHMYIFLTISPPIIILAQADALFVLRPPRAYTSVGQKKR